MEERLRALALAHGGVFGCAQAAAAGTDSKQLSRLVSAGELVRVRRGAFVLHDVYAAADQDERYRLRCAAVLSTRSGSAALAHQSAVAMTGLPLVGVDLNRIDVCADVTSVNVSSGLVTHPWPSTAHVSRVRGVRIIRPGLALMQMVVSAGTVASIIAMDAALHRGVVTRAELEAARGALTGTTPKWRTRLDRVCSLIDPASESPGETRTRLVLHDAGVDYRTQVGIVDEWGFFVGRVDFLAWGQVVVEFDGLCKYSGADARLVVGREKAREERLKELGFEVVRITWADLERPDRVVDMVRRARARAAGRRVSGAVRVGLEAPEGSVGASWGAGQRAFPA